MIDQSKTYRTKDGREVRIYALDGAVIGAAAPVHGAFKSPYGWECTTWYLDGRWTHANNSDGDLIESDPHGILPRHRELLAAAIGEVFVSKADATGVRGSAFNEISPCYQASLIALAKLDNERGGV